MSAPQQADILILLLHPQRPAWRAARAAAARALNTAAVAVPAELPRKGQTRRPRSGHFYFAARKWIFLLGLDNYCRRTLSSATWHWRRHRTWARSPGPRHPVL